MAIPDFVRQHEMLLNQYEALPQGLAVALCIAGILYLFSGSFIRRLLAIVNFGAIGALLGHGLAHNLGANPMLTAWAAAMVLMAVSYPVHRAALAGSAFLVMGFTVMELCAMAALPDQLTAVLMLLAASATAAISFVIEQKVMAAVFALQGSFLFLAGSFSAAPAFKLDGFPMYNMIGKHPFWLPVCVILPAAIGFFAQLALYDPTVKERPI